MKPLAPLLLATAALGGFALPPAAQARQGYYVNFRNQAREPVVVDFNLASRYEWEDYDFRGQLRLEPGQISPMIYTEARPNFLGDSFRGWTIRRESEPRPYTMLFLSYDRIKETRVCVDTVYPSGDSYGMNQHAHRCKPPLRTPYGQMLSDRLFDESVSGQMMLEVTYSDTDDAHSDSATYHVALTAPEMSPKVYSTTLRGLRGVPPLPPATEEPAPRGR